MVNAKGFRKKGYHTVMFLGSSVRTAKEVK
jgi:hypothetical protein